MKHTRFGFLKNSEENASCAVKSTSSRVAAIVISAAIGALAGFALGDLASGTVLGAVGGIILAGGG